MRARESIEALGERAERALFARSERASREWVGTDVRFDPRGPQVLGEDPAMAPWPDVDPLVDAYAQARALDPALAVLFAEAIVAARTSRAWRAYRVAWAKGPVAVAGAEPTSPWELAHVLALEGEPGRRAALMASADARAEEHRDAARAVVEATRACVDALGYESAPRALSQALGLGEPAVIEGVCEALLRATDDAFRELDHWVRGRLELSRDGDLTPADRARTLVLHRTSALISQGDRVGVCTRWLTRVGLSSALSRVRDESETRARTRTRGVGLVRVRAGERALLVGAPYAAALGAVQFSDAVGEGLAYVFTGASGLASLRAGAERVHLRAAAALSRALWINPSFVTREAGVDRGVREGALLELLHAELLRVRSDAALALAWLDALARTPGFAEVSRARFGRAVASRPAPSWMPHLVAREEAPRACASVLGSTLEAFAFASLRERFDEDFFRNPRAGEGLRRTLDRWRTQPSESLLRENSSAPAAAPGAVVTLADPGAAAPPAPLDYDALVAPWAARVREVWHEARR